MAVDSHRRPVAPDRIGSEPWSAVESIRLSVKLILALIAVTAGAPAAWWSACASDARGGTGPLPAAANGDRGPAGDRDDQTGDDRQQTLGGNGAQELHHGMTFLVA